MKKMAILLIVLMVISAGFLCGCNEETEEEIDYVDANLNVLGLTVDDLSGDFVISGETYKSTPYYIEGGFFDGTRVSESYAVNFTESDTSLITEFLIRYESKEECKSVLDTVKTELSGDFPEISVSIIGDDSYFGQKTYTVLGSEVSLYLLCFRTADVLVMLTGTAPLQVTFRGYGNIIESNINAVLK